MNQPRSENDDRSYEMAAGIGLINAATGQLTPLVQLAADPFREYKFWLDRDRRLHAENYHELLSKQYYEGKAVIELGSGFGCNLFSMNGTGCRMVGVEPVGLYRQMTSILAERERIPLPEVVNGHAESIPFDDASFDIVFFYSCHEYTDIRVALSEAARVVRRGGQLQIIGNSLDGFLFSSGAQVVRQKGSGLRSYMLTLANTLAYSMIGRRVFMPKGHSLTTAPIYPSIFHMSRWMAAAGLKFRRDSSRRVGGEMCFIADRT